MDFTEYRPGRLGLSASEEPMARRLWTFLNAPETVQRMVTATDLGHPAVEGIRDELVQSFGTAITVERNRQRIGHMTRQILEHHGFEIDQTEVKLNAFPFTKATRYRRRGGFTLHAFRSTADARDVCISDTRTSEGFPEMRSGRWVYWSCITSRIQAAVGFGIDDVEAVQTRVVRDGYFRLRLPRILRAGSA